MNKPGRSNRSGSKKTKVPATTRASGSLESVYEQLKESLARHAPPLKLCEMQMGTKRGVQLVAPRPVVIPGAYGGKPVEAQLAATILQKDFVGFYFMCMYLNDEVKKKLSPALLKLLKGKACFHVKTLEDGLLRDIEAALVLGVKSCRERGWLQ